MAGVRKKKQVEQFGRDENKVTGPTPAVTAPPPAGGADPPQTSAPVEEKNSPKTTGDRGEVATNGATLVPDPFEVLAEFQMLDEETSDKLEELADDYQALLNRFEAELLPLVDRMQAFLSTHGTMHIPGLPEWVQWRDAFLKRLKIKMSVRTLQRKLKQYRDEEDAGEKAAKRKAERVPVFEESHASQMCKEGAHLARAVKDLRVSRETLIKMADRYLAKLHGNAAQSESDRDAVVAADDSVVINPKTRQV